MKKSLLTLFGILIVVLVLYSISDTTADISARFRIGSLIIKDTLDGGMKIDRLYLADSLTVTNNARIGGSISQGEYVLLQHTVMTGSYDIYNNSVPTNSKTNFHLIKNTGSYNFYVSDWGVEELGVLQLDSANGVLCNKFQVVDKYQTNALPSSKLFCLRGPTNSLEINDADTAASTEDGWIEVWIGGEKQFIRTYSSK